jgi:ribosomal-protein-alanine N-acetyltransferase
VTARSTSRRSWTPRRARCSGRSASALLTGLDEGTAEVGYWVKREARGRGVASRALRLVSDWTLRELGFGRLQLRADERNVPSQRVAVNVGFTREGVLRASRFNARQNRRVDFVMYSLLPGELG